MSSVVVTPAVGYLPSTEGDLANTTVASSEDWVYDIIITNTTASAVTARIYISDGTNKGYFLYDYSLNANSSLVVYKGVPLPTNWRIGGRAGSASAISWDGGGSEVGRPPTKRAVTLQ